MSQKLCEICNSRGVYRGKKCVCAINKELSMFLPVSLTSVKTDKSKNSQIANLIDKNVLLITDYSSFQPVIKTFLIYQFIANSGNYKYWLGSGKDLVSWYLSEDPIENIFNFKLAVFEIGIDPDNKAMPSLFEYIVNGRMARKLPTWVFIHQTKTDRIKQTYGEEFHNIIMSSKFLTLNLKGGK